MDYDKPWMRPTQYTDAQPVDSARDEVPLESDFDPIEHEPRERGDRDAVKPQDVSRDTEPMHYIPWHQRLGDVLDVDDNDEPEEEKS